MLLEIFNKAIKTISKDESRLIRKRWSGGGYIIPEKSELPIFNEEEKNWIKRNGKINVVFNEYMAPLSYLNSSGRPAGYAIEILELLRLYSGLDIDYTSSKDFNEQQELVLKSKTPYITILTPNKNRAIFFDFSSEFSSSPYIIVQRKNNVEINDPIIAIPRDHAIEEYTRQYIKFKEIKLTSNFIEALDTVKNSEADYTIIPLNIADYYNHGYFDDILEVKEVVEKIPTAAANFAVKKEEHILVDIINKTLIAIPPNELQTLENYWRSNSLPAKQTWKDYRYTIYTILISSLILILVSIGWTLYTRQHYRQRLKATKALDGAIDLLRESKHPFLVDTLGTKASWYGEQGKWCEALASYSEIAQINELDSNSEFYARDLFSICHCYHELGNWSEVITYGLKAREIFKEEKRIFEISWCDLNIADAHAELGDGEQAIFWGRKANDIATLRKDNEMICKSNFVMAKGYKVLEKYQDAENLLLAAQDLVAKSNDWTQITKIERELISIYRLTERSTEADEAERRLSTLTDSFCYCTTSVGASKPGAYQSLLPKAPLILPINFDYLDLIPAIEELSA